MHPTTPRLAKHGNRRYEGNGSHSLHQRHRDELHASAIPDELIAERGYRSITAAEATTLGFAEYQCRDGMLIPLTDTFGRNGRHALKPDQPRAERREGKPDRKIKYEYPAGQAPILDVPPRCQAQLADAAVPLVFTEGAKKADCLAGLGYCAINIWGVHSWARQTKPGGGFATLEEIADWEPLKPTLPGREVYLIFDSDAFTKESVGLALRRLISFLERHDALVYVVHLPDSEDGAKLGADDFVARHGADALADLVDRAEPEGREAMRREIRALREERSAIFHVLHNPDLTAGERIVAVSAVCQTQSRISHGHRGPIRVTVDAPKNPDNPHDQERVGLAADIGLSKNTVRRALDRVFADDAPIVKRTVHETSASGMPRAHIELETKCTTGTPGMLWQLARLKPAPIEPKPKKPRCIVEAPHVHHCTETCSVTGVIEERDVKVSASDPPDAQNEYQGGDEDSGFPDTQNGYEGPEESPVSLRSPSYVLNTRILGTTPKCRRCGRSWDAHGSEVALGLDLICRERLPSGAVLLEVVR